MKVAFGAHRLIIRSMSFFEVASWKFFSIWSISQRSACRCSACSAAELVLEPPQAARQTTMTADRAADQEPPHAEPPSAQARLGVGAER